jgi:thiol-disulfide isomerase/thioredoxin
MGIALQRWLVLALQLFLILAPTVTPRLAPKAVEPQEEDDDEELEEQYLYDVDGGVVIDYMPSAAEADPVYPDFLYSANNGPRIVEFYAPWCPHCQAFREEFVRFAGQMVEGASSVGVDLKVYAISCEVHKTLCKNWEMIGFPQLRLFRAGETNFTGQALYYSLKPNSIFKHLKIPAHIDMTEENKKKREPPVTVRTYKRTQEDIFNDAHLSFHFALRNGVFMTNAPLPFKNRFALDSWLSLLHRTIPPTSSMHPLVRALREDFEDLVEDEDTFLEIVSRYPPPQKRWSLGCTHGRKGAGYTCGLWELFHIVTVGVTEWNQLSLVDLSMAIGVEEAAITIRNYVEHFFGCEVCRMNFVSAFDSCAHDRCRRLDNNATSMSEWMELPLWLFETHNTVNARLLREKGAREGYTPTSQDGIDRQWPARDDCPQCWREDGGWVENSVVEHLRLEYW